VTASESSSGHMVNGDRRLSKWDRGRWLWVNWLNNTRAASDLDPSLTLAAFNAGAIAADWQKIDALASPSRRLCDLFWRALPWPRIAAELADSVKVLEIGCGTGRYGVLAQECLGGAFAGYVGLDAVAHDEWQGHRANPKFAFLCADSGSTTQHLDGVNLIITQSALEHFEKDLTFFRQLADYVATSQRPIIQIHLMPSAACITTFPWHGVRQYTPRTVSRITRMFAAQTGRRLFSLGSRACNRVHRRYITLPWLMGRGDQRGLRPGDYERDLREAVRQDDASPKHGEACFHALVLQSQVARDIFLEPRNQP
jgi:SAM-dependent methyltransferase